MNTRRSFLSGVAGIIGVSASPSIVGGDSSGRSMSDEGEQITIALYYHPSIGSEAAVIDSIATAHISYAVSELPAYRTPTVISNGVLDMDGHDSVDKAREELKERDPEPAADITILLYGPNESFDDGSLGGSGGSSFAVSRFAHLLPELDTSSRSGTGMANYALSALLHEVGHCLGKGHKDGSIVESDDEVRVSPMVSAYVYRRLDVGDRSVRYVHRFENAEG